MRHTSVVVVDDHRTFTDLLAAALTAEPGYECIGTAGSAAEAIVLVDRVRPDVVIMDVNLGDGDGLVVTAELTSRHPDLRVIVLTAHVDRSLFQRTADSGACCLLPKDGSLSDLMQSLASARRGALAVHPVLLRTLMTRAPKPSAPIPPLTRREHEVLEMLAAGMDARTIAGRLGISVNTSRSYIKTLLTKCGAHSQLEAVATARRRGILGERDIG